MSPINGHKAGIRRNGGFTLVEVMTAAGVSALVCAGVLSAFLFLSKNLTRLTNRQQLETKSRRAIHQFGQDVGAATQITAASNTSLTLTTGGASITYTYSGGALTRTAAGTATTLLNNLTAFDFNYYNSGGTAITTPTRTMKSAEFSFTSQYAEGGSARAVFAAVSPRVLLRNSTFLLGATE